MKKNKFKKTIALTYLTTILFGLFIPFNQSFASSGETLSISSDKSQVNYGGTATITGKLFIPGSKSVEVGQIINPVEPITFLISPDNGNNLAGNVCTPTFDGTFYSCSLVFTGNTTNDNVTFIISAKTTDSSSINPPVKLLVVNSGNITCPPKQILNSTQDKCITPVTDTTYTPLAPLPGLGNKNCPITNADGTITMGINNCVDTQKSDSNPCPFGSYLNIMIKIILGVAAVLAMVMVVMGGIEYMTSDLVSSKEAGKETIRNAILGLLIALGAYLILNTINPQLLSACLDKLPMSTIVIGEEDVPQTPDKNGRYPNGAKKGAPWNDSVGKITPPCPSEPANNEVATNCLPRLVTVFPLPECTKIGQPSCTSTRNLNTSNLRKIQYGCLCDLVITGGTESWLHGGKKGNTTHKLDSATIDLRFNAKLDAYIKSGDKIETPAGTRYEKDGISYLLEPKNTHWHVGP
ncbi:MAG: pilin [Patescibacteria group bacterium]